jgi:hypothetical protein
VTSGGCLSGDDKSIARGDFLAIPIVGKVCAQATTPSCRWETTAAISSSELFMASPCHRLDRRIDVIASRATLS